MRRPHVYTNCSVVALQRLHRRRKGAAHLKLELQNVLASKQGLSCGTLAVSGSMPIQHSSSSTTSSTGTSERQEDHRTEQNGHDAPSAALSEENGNAEGQASRWYQTTDRSRSRTHMHCIAGSYSQRPSSAQQFHERSYTSNNSIKNMPEQNVEPDVWAFWGELNRQTSV